MSTPHPTLQILDPDGKVLFQTSRPELANPKAQGVILAALDKVKPPRAPRKPRAAKTTPLQPQLPIA